MGGMRSQAWPNTLTTLIEMQDRGGSYSALLNVKQHSCGALVFFYHRQYRYARSGFGLTKIEKRFNCVCRTKEKRI